jgi:hypothetical protein
MIMHICMNDILNEYTSSITIGSNLNDDASVGMKWADK